MWKQKHQNYQERLVKSKQDMGRLQDNWTEQKNRCRWSNFCNAFETVSTTILLSKQEITV